MIHDLQNSLRILNFTEFLIFFLVPKLDLVNVPLDVNECDTYGSCSQMCVNTEGSYTCSCVEGYVLQPDNKSCKAKNSKF